LADIRLVTRREALAQAVTERAVELVVSALDVNALLDRVDLNAVLDQVDIDRLLGRMDLNDLEKHIDVDALIQQTDLGAIIAASSSGVAGDVLDVVRSQAVGPDEFIARWIGRLRRRSYTGPADRPRPGRGYDCARGRRPALRAPGRHPGEPARQYAGFASRFAAFAVDAGVSLGVYLLALAAISFAARMLTGKDITCGLGPFALAGETFGPFRWPSQG
jgi:hypothetical protein